MKNQINLKTIVEALDMIGNDSRVYLNTQTGESIFIYEDNEMYLEMEEEEMADLADWELEEAKQVRAIYEAAYLQLPSKYEIHEYQIMEDFCEALSNKQIGNSILQSMRGRGAFRNFQDKAFQYGIRDDWFDFRKNAFYNIAKAWCEEKGIAYKDDRPIKKSAKKEKVAEHLVMEIEAQGNLTMEEISAILRGADEMIASGGRSSLAKLLNGSKAKTILQRALDESPVYGYFSHLSEAKIMHKIDWVIQHGYLTTELYNRLPLLVFTPKGWEIEKDTMATELLGGFNEILKKGTPFDMSHLKDRNREMILLLLEKVRNSADRRYIFLLEAWAAIDYKKVRQRINSVIKSLEKISQ